MTVSERSTQALSNIKQNKKGWLKESRDGLPVKGGADRAFQTAYKTRKDD